MTALSGSLPIRVEQDVVLARQTVRQVAVACKLSLINQTKLVTAASELARNAVIYGGGGDMAWEVVERGVRRGVKLVFSDNGPGIPDVAQALTDGWSSGSGMGLGLSGSRRLVDEFELESALGQGTRVTLIKWI